MNETDVDMIFQRTARTVTTLLAGKKTQAELAVVAGTLRAIADVAEQSAIDVARAQGEDVEGMRQLFSLCQEAASGMVRMITIAPPDGEGGDDDGTHS